MRTVVVSFTVLACMSSSVSAQKPGATAGIFGVLAHSQGAHGESHAGQQAVSLNQ
jgi:hypothetical protein